MATTNSTIIASYTLIAFARNNGRMQVGQFEKDGESFSSCIFTNPAGEKTFVGFSSKLGELTPREIAAQKDHLQVVQLSSGNYYLCKQGQNTWEDVDLGI